MAVRGSPVRRGVALAAGGLLCVAGLLSARMISGAASELRAAEAAARDGDAAAKVRHLRRAMAYYLPGNPYVRRAEQALFDEAARAEARGEPGCALEILHELRSSILALRGSTRPFAASLPEINRRIAALSASRPDAALSLRGPAGALALRQRLDQPPEPDPCWTLVGLLGFLIYSVGGLLLFVYGLRPDASLVRRRFGALLGLVVLGFALFATGMACA